jgi:ribonuclease HII
MKEDLSRLSLSELRRRFAVDPDADAPPPRVVRRLAADPRAGARRLAEALERWRRREQRERRRLRSLLRYEGELWKDGRTRVAGVDEAGVGPLAGPVVAAAVVLAPGVGIRDIEGFDDSKQLDAETRDRLERRIRERAVAVSVARAEVGEVDRLNVYHAALLAMARAVAGLPEPPEHLLVDAREVPGVAMGQTPLVGGDGKSASIAAASILAKTARDRWMEVLDARHPGYGFARHKGYPTAEHQEAIRRLGPCPVHRRSFGALEEILGGCSDRFYRLRERVWELAGGDETDEEEIERVEAELTAARDELPRAEYKKLRVLFTRRRKGLSTRYADG